MRARPCGARRPGRPSHGLCSPEEPSQPQGQGRVPRPSKWAAGHSAHPRTPTRLPARTLCADSSCYLRKKNFLGFYQFLFSLRQKASYHSCLFLWKSGKIVHAQHLAGMRQPLAEMTASPTGRGSPPSGGPQPVAPRDCPEIPGPWVHCETPTEPAGPGLEVPHAPPRPPCPAAPRHVCRVPALLGEQVTPTPSVHPAPTCPDRLSDEQRLPSTHWVPGHTGPGGLRRASPGSPRLRERPPLSPTHAGPRGGKGHASRAALPFVSVLLLEGPPPTRASP